MIERFEVRLARAEAQAARAFETVAQILERDDAARDSDRRALIDAVRRLESIRTNLTGAAQTGETRGDGFPQPPALDPKAPFDLKAAVSQIAMRRHELEDRAGREPAPRRRTRERSLSTTRRPCRPTAIRPWTPSRSGPAAATGAAATPRRRSRNCCSTTFGPSALKLDDMRRERADPSASVDLGAMRAEIEAMSRSLADLAPRNAVVALEGAIRDLVQRVEMLRQSGHGKSMLAPLEAMAAEFRAALKSA